METKIQSITKYEVVRVQIPKIIYNLQILSIRTIWY